VQQKQVELGSALFPLETRFPIPVLMLYIGKFTGRRSRCSDFFGLGDPGIESPRERDFPCASRQVLAPTLLPVQRVPGLPRRVKRPKRVADHPPSSNAEVKNGLEQYPA
jgi:hypothetical protein